jgi:hypothetical protein
MGKLVSLQVFFGDFGVFFDPLGGGEAETMPTWTWTLN